MAYIGNTSVTTNVQPATDFFSGDGVTTAFTLSRTVVSAYTIEAVINNVQQNPSTAYGVSGNVITFTSAPPSGTNNIYVNYNSIQGQVVGIGQGTVGAAQLTTGAPAWDISGNVTALGNLTSNQTINGILSTNTVTASSGNLTFTGTGSIILPKGTSAQRPSSPVSGMTRYNSTFQALEFYNGSTWTGVGVQDGSSFANAAASAVAIQTLTGTTSNGFYWIIIDGVPTQVWCDMANGGWMLAMQTANNNSYWTYDDAIWTNTTLINEGQAWNFAGHIKTRVYTNRNFTQIRMVAGADLANGLIENWTYSNMISLMGTGQLSSNSRTAWINWFTAGVGADPLLQPNCNQAGVNRAFNYMYVKLGITGNNEGDCATNDSAFGWGVRGISPYGNVNAFGAFSSSGRNNNYYGSIFVR